MRHPERQQPGPLPGRGSWPSAFVFFLLFFNILASPAFALPATPSTSLAASSAQTLLAPSRNRPCHAASQSSSLAIPPGQHGSETPQQPTAGAASAASKPTSTPDAASSPGIRGAASAAAAETPTPARILPHPLKPVDDSSIIVHLAAAASPPSFSAPYEPFVTPPPDQDADLAKMGYSMTTFYTCDTIGGQEHCGWHVPVLKADGPTTRTDVRVVLAVVSCLAGILAWGLV
ncbi:hypothetical protein TARUN_7630 [Trichoderma arundinaceum]|uniref:Uncharacterized protein n=1 Tax=Trichoderma arundinaceum TaxID=490622 RepID=A0A395NES1_TRIAR|nr:hypothetical protein TARUN_7630 [Trichoderma arundinaceum]